MPEKLYVVTKPCRIGSRPVAAGTFFRRDAPNPPVLVVGSLSGRFEAYRPEDEDAARSRAEETGEQIRHARVVDVLFARNALKEFK